MEMSMSLAWTITGLYAIGTGICYYVFAKDQDKYGHEDLRILALIGAFTWPFFLPYFIYMRYK